MTVVGCCAGHASASLPHLLMYCSRRSSRFPHMASAASTCCALRVSFKSLSGKSTAT